MGSRHWPYNYSEANKIGVSGSHLDLNRAPYVSYGGKYIDLVSLALFPGTGH